MIVRTLNPYSRVELPDSPPDFKRRYGACVCGDGVL